MNRLVSINNTYDSYQSLIDFYQQNRDKFFDRIPLKIEQFFAANMSAALGAILDSFSSNLNDIVFEFIEPRIESILQKNEFLSYYGGFKIADSNQTTIRYQRLSPLDGKFFKHYVIDELIVGHRNDLPKMTPAVREKIVEAIYEIFVNAQIHSETKEIYTCGQFFPSKNKIEFTIVDTGVGFEHRILERFGKKLPSHKAIAWAVEDRNTTKAVTGGLGLSILKEFIRMNKGSMQIVSRDGYYQFSHNEEISKPFIGEFPGTIVNLQFCTDDTNNYSLLHELDENDIF